MEDSIINGNLVTFVGYFFITIAYLIYVFANLKTREPYLIFGSIMIFVGYLLLAKNYFEVVMDEMDIQLWQKNETSQPVAEGKNNLVFDTFTDGHFILFLFFLLSFFIPINEHKKESDVVAIVGHLLLFTHHFVFLSYLMMLIYYTLYFVRNFKDTNKYIVNVLQCLGALFLIFHYFEGLVSYSYLFRW